MLPIVTPVEMGKLDAADSRSIEELIELAGWHVARKARAMLGGVYGRRVTAIAGPGKNGADAHVAARVLADWGVAVETVTPDSNQRLGGDLIIDGAFGTGVDRPYSPPLVVAGTPVLAIDIPSGVDGLTGESHGSPLPALQTLTFEAFKPGLLLQPGAALSGHVEIVDLDLGSAVADAGLFVRDDARRLLPRAQPSDHKWKRAVWVIGGSPGMHGAPQLAATAVLKSGGGMAWCSVPGDSAASAASEVVFSSLDGAGWHEQVLAQAQRFGALVIGPGIGRADETAVGVRRVVASSPTPVVVDGDALRLLGDSPRLRPDVVLTPHGGEFEALAGRRPGPDRFAETRQLAVELNATILLKGPLTIVADPTGAAIAVNHGDARLATAGSGDVLAGMIGSYLAAGLGPANAAALAAWVHGEAGRSQSRVGMVASDLLAGLPLASGQLAASFDTGEQ